MSVSNGSARLGVAAGSNRTNSSGAPLGALRSRGSQVINNIVAAGSILPVPAAGTQFYLLFTSAPLAVRPSGGVFNTYSQGTGLNLDNVNQFDLLEMQNTTSAPIIFSIFVGFDSYIDNRLILANSSTPIVAYPTYSSASSLAAVSIPDISGQPFNDINGGKWFAIQRAAVLVFNPDTGVTLLLQKAGAATSSGPAVGVIYPQTSLNYPASGNFSLSVGGGNVNAIVSELYTSLADTR